LLCRREKKDLPEILDFFAGRPTVRRLDIIDTTLKGMIKALLDAGVF